MRDQHGVAYLALLLMVAMLGAAVAAVGPIWSAAQQRDKERYLLHVGEQFRRAIAQYYESSPGEKQYPQRFDDLLLDPRYAGIRRYLRQVYRDPMTNSTQWGTIAAPQGGIMGVYSLSTATPMKQDGFPEKQQGFVGKSSYAHWHFAYIPRANQRTQ